MVPQEVRLYHNGTRYDREAARAARNQAAAGLTGDFATQAANNPYGNAEFTPNWYQKLAENIFGDYSARDRFYQQQDQSAMEYISQLLDAQRQQDYNDPASQALRMRAAGMNPDLLGTEGVSDAASAAPDDTPPEGMTNEDVVGPGLIQSGIDLALSACSSAFDLPSHLEKAIGIISMCTDIQGKSYDNTAKAINNLANGQDQVLGLLANLWPTYDPGDVPEGYTKDDVKRLSASEIQAMIGDLGLSKRDRQFIKSLMGMTTYDKNGNITTGLQQRVQELRTKRLADAQKEVGVVSSIGFDQDMEKWSAQFYEEIGKAQNAMQKVLVSAATAEGQYRDDYYSYEGLGGSVAASDKADADYNTEFTGALDANESATYEMAQRRLAGLEAQLDSIMEETFSSLIKSINDSDASDTAKTVQRTMVYQMRASYGNFKLERAAKAAARGAAKGKNTIGQQVKDLTEIAGNVIPKK